MNIESLNDDGDDNENGNDGNDDGDDDDDVTAAWNVIVHTHNFEI